MTFQFNNFHRKQRGLAPLVSVTIPYITMSGTHPTFYPVPVTEALNIAVMTGQYPTIKITILKCVSAISGHQHSASVNEGMESVAYRKVPFGFQIIGRSGWKAPRKIGYAQ